VPVTISIVEYDATWPDRYEAEATLLRDALGPCALRIDHVGSTSVPGLAAKPIVDIQVSVASLTPIARYLEPLEQAGYTYFEYLNEVGIDDYPFFAKPSAPPRSFHIHVAEAGTFNERRHLAFRDWLRAHPEDAAAYEHHKRELATREWETGDHYANAKTDFVTTIVSRALGEGS
jgi:GrpB-like predicted nucleotidyltransferase (UPF0157 family)